MPFEAPTILELAARRLVKNGRPPRRLRRQPVQKYPITIEREYSRELRQYLSDFQHLVQRDLIAALPRIVNEFQQSRPNLVRADDATDDLQRIIKTIDVQIDERWTPETIRRLAQRKGIDISRYNDRVIRGVLMKVIGVDVINADAFLPSSLSLFTTQNVNLITSMKDDALKKMENIVFSGLQQGIRHEEISKQIEKWVDPDVGNVKARADLIARDQISKLNGQLTMLRQTSLGVERYRWRTAGDDRVRPTHQDNDGKIFSWDDPPSKTGHPGEDYQCRCYAEPVLEDLVPGMEIDEDAA